MANIAVSVGADQGLNSANGVWGPYWINTTTAVIIFLEPNGDIYKARTTNGGADWINVSIENADIRNIAVWFDQETPGDTGNLLHLAWMDSKSGPDAGDIHYQSYDISTDTEGTLRQIDGAVTVSITNEDNQIAITKARNGNLVVAWRTSTEIECVRSVNSGEDWVDVDDVYETVGQMDYCLLYPANVDAGDCAAIFWDGSSNEISVKMYDESATSWTETTILGSMEEDGVHINLDGAVRHSDGFILCAAHTNDDSADNDLVTFTVNPNNISTPPINTAKANVVTNQDNSGQVALLINQQNNEVYVSYLKGGVFLASVDVVYHISSTNMDSWGTEQAYSEGAADDLRRVQAGRTISDNGGFFQPVFFNDDLEDIFVNLVNDVAIASSVGGPDVEIVPAESIGSVIGEASGVVIALDGGDRI